jgi:hypothetical protein
LRFVVGCLIVSSEAGGKTFDLTGVQAPLSNRLPQGGTHMRKGHRKGKGRKHGRHGKKREK